jgi:type I restriction enzyme M protein
MIREDIIEGIIALPPKLFYGTGIPGCVLILNRNKRESHRKKIIFIYAARDYEEGKVRNKLRESDLQKIVSAFKDYKDIDITSRRSTIGPEVVGSNPTRSISSCEGNTVLN